MSDRLKLIKRYQQIERDLKLAAENNRPVCQVLAGDMLAVAEQLHASEAAQDFLNELQEQNQKPPGPFSGIAG